MDCGKQIRNALKCNGVPDPVRQWIDSCYVYVTSKTMHVVHAMQKCLELSNGNFIVSTPSTIKLFDGVGLQVKREVVLRVTSMVQTSENQVVALTEGYARKTSWMYEFVVFDCDLMILANHSLGPSTYIDIWNLNGKVLYCHNTRMLHLFDPKTLSSEPVLCTGNKIKDLIVCGNIIMVCTSQDIQIYNCRTYELLHSMVLICDPFAHNGSIYVRELWALKRLNPKTFEFETVVVFPFHSCIARISYLYNGDALVIFGSGHVHYCNVKTKQTKHLMTITYKDTKRIQALSSGLVLLGF